MICEFSNNPPPSWTVLGVTGQVARIVACTQTLFYFSFRSFQNIGELARTSALHWRAINPLRFIFYHPGSTSLYTDVVLFLFSFFSKHRRARQQSKRARTFPTTTPLRWRSINPLRFIFYHPRSTDFEEKIDGL